MTPGRSEPVLLGAIAVVVVLGTAGTVLASPAPVSGCPPCDRGFVHGASSHGLETEVSHGEATVRVHENDSATWTVAVVPTNETVLDRLAEDRSLARSVAADSFGTRYGGGIEHELLDVDVADGAFVMRYRTHGVVRSGPFGTHVLTYFRDSPGAYVYTGLGADEVTVVAPDGTTVARGFGDVEGDRMTATELPDVRDGPFVVVAPSDSPAPGLLGLLAVGSVLWGVVARNLVYFVALPGGVLVGGLAVLRRVTDAPADRSPTRVGGAVAAIGGLVVAGSLVAERAALPAVTNNLLVGLFVGAVLVALGASVATPAVRRHLTGPRMVGVGVAVGLAAAVITEGPFGGRAFQGALTLGTALLPAMVGLGWGDAMEASWGDRLFAGLSVVVVGALAATAPLTALGGTLFVVVPVAMTLAAAGIVAVAIPLYLLGAAAGTPDDPEPPTGTPG